MTRANKGTYERMGGFLLTRQIGGRKRGERRDGASEARRRRAALERDACGAGEADGGRRRRGG